MKKDYLIKFSTLIFLSSILGVYFNGVSFDREESISEGGPSIDRGGEQVNLQVNDQMSFHHSSSVLINNIMNDAIRDGAPSIIASDSRFTNRTYIKNNSTLADLDWPAIPRCSVSDRGRSRAKVKMTLWYDINAQDDSVSATLHPSIKNRLKVDLNLPRSQVYFKIVFEKYRCGTLRWTREVTASATGLRIKSDANFNFSGSDFRFVGLANESIENLGWPDIESDSYIVDLIGEMVDEGSWVNNLCIETDCLNSFVLPEIKSSFSWNDMIAPYVNTALAGVKEKISQSSSLTASGIGLESTVSLKNVILGGGESVSVLFDSDTSLDFVSDSCADNANLIQSSLRFGALNNSLKTGLGAKFSSQLIETMAFAVVKKGHLCKPMPLPLPSSGTVNLLMVPDGDVFIDQGTYHYDLESRNKVYRDFGPSPLLVTETKNAGTDSALYLNLPVAFKSTDPNMTSTLKGTLKVFFNLDTEVNALGASTGVQFSIKEMVLQTLTGRISYSGLSTTASDLRPDLVKLLDNYKEKRVVERVQKKCHSDRAPDPSQLTEADYILTFDGQSIFYTEEKNFIENCTNCSKNLNLNLSFLGKASSGDHISRYTIDANSNLAFLFGGNPYGTSSSSSEATCPNLALTPEEQERLEDSREGDEGRLGTGIRDQI